MCLYIYISQLLVTKWLMYKEIVKPSAPHISLFKSCFVLWLPAWWALWLPWWPPAGCNNALMYLLIFTMNFCYWLLLCSVGNKTYYYYYYQNIPSHSGECRFICNVLSIRVGVSSVPAVMFYAIYVCFQQIHFSSDDSKNISTSSEMSFINQCQGLGCETMLYFPWFTLLFLDYFLQAIMNRKLLAKKSLSQTGFRRGNKSSPHFTMS